MDNVQFCSLLAKEELPMKHLTVEQRYTISVMLPKKMPFFFNLTNLTLGGHIEKYDK
jgi:hypothetical protein